MANLFNKLGLNVVMGLAFAVAHNGIDSADRISRAIRSLDEKIRDGFFQKEIFELEREKEAFEVGLGKTQDELDLLIWSMRGLSQDLAELQKSQAKFGAEGALDPALAALISEKQHALDQKKLEVARFQGMISDLGQNICDIEGKRNRYQATQEQLSSESRGLPEYALRLIFAQDRSLLTEEAILENDFRVLDDLGFVFGSVSSSQVRELIDLYNSVYRVRAQFATRSEMVTPQEFKFNLARTALEVLEMFVAFNLREAYRFNFSVEYCKAFEFLSNYNENMAIIRAGEINSRFDEVLESLPVSILIKESLLAYECKLTSLASRDIFVGLKLSPDDISRCIGNFGYVKNFGLNLKKIVLDLQRRDKTAAVARLFEILVADNLKMLHNHEILDFDPIKFAVISDDGGFVDILAKRLDIHTRHSDEYGQTRDNYIEVKFNGAKRLGEKFESDATFKQQLLEEYKLSKIDNADFYLAHQGRGCRLFKLTKLVF